MAAAYGFTVDLGPTESDEQIALLLPQWGICVGPRLEYVLEAHLARYWGPAGYLAGLLPIGVRLFSGTATRPLYLSAAAGLGWTDLTFLPEIDRRFNFLLQGGIGMRWSSAGKRGRLLELRLVHLSNGNTAGRNFGLNSVALVAGWRIR